MVAQEPTYEELKASIDAILEPGLTNAQVDARMLSALRLFQLDHLLRRRAKENLHARAVAMASANRDYAALRQLANKNLARMGR